MSIKVKKRFLRRVSAAVGALAVAASVLALSGPATADTTGGNVPAGPYNLTITKLKNPISGGTSTNGTQQNVSALTPLAGVVFNIAPVNGIDLSTQAGWVTASTLTVNSSGQVSGGGTNYNTGSATSLPATDSNGVTTYSTSTAAVYKVTEVSAPAGTQLGTPFLVTLPLPQNNNWLTNVYVYPKNTVQNAPSKTVDDSGSYGIGSTVNWSISSTVPNQAAGNPLTSYVISDALDSRLTPPAASAVTVSLKSPSGTSLALPAADYAVTVSGQTVTVTFTPAGLTYLTANPSAVITVGIPTVVNGTGNGTIQNVANQAISSQTGGTTSTPSNPSQSTWGTVTLHKVDPAGNALSGAKFQVFTSAADAKSLSNPVAVAGSTTFTSDASGNVVIASLKAQNNGAGANLTYYLVETQAPAGYLVAPAFAQSAGGYAVTVAPGTSANATINVTDPQASPISLPLTGSTGTAIFIGGGLALAALAAVAGVLVLRRRSAAGGVASELTLES